MIALTVVVKLVRSVSVTLDDCDVRSDSVRATSVTLRSTATPDENSITPKNSVSMIGTITANSTAALPLASRRRPEINSRTRSEIFCISMFLVALSFVWSVIFFRKPVSTLRKRGPAGRDHALRLDVEGGGRGQQ